jgi:3-deoxy-D-manno-octulosonic-acid transferase
MISNGDRERIIQIGARAETVSVNGNSKYDMLIRSTTPGMRENVRRALQIAPDALVIVAGSTRSGEEEILLDAYKRILTPFHDAVLILAPRHLKRVTQITGLVKKKGLKCHLRSELVSQGHTRKEGIIIIDCFGELFNTYSAANIAFCGASLVPLGGQNPLEPAAWGTPLFHGPHMEDFSDAMQLLGAYNAGIEVTGAIDLAEKVIFYLNNPDLLAQKGMAAKKALMEGSNVAEVQASLIKGLACKG